MRVSYFPFIALLAHGTTTAGNPLASKDQFALDALAKALAQDSSLDLFRSAARAEYIATLVEFGQDINDTVKSDIDIAIDELVFSSVQKAVNNDPAHPKVYWVDAPPRDAAHWSGLDVPGGRYSYDNPDCIYRTIPISDKYEYEIHGKRTGKGPMDVTFSLISNPNSQNTVASLMGDDLQVNEDGTFVVKIGSGEKPADAKNYIQSNWQAKQLFVRNNLGDWNTETPDELTVTLIKSESDEELPEPASNETILADARKNIAESSFFYGFGALNIKTMLTNKVNELKEPSQSQTLGTLTSQASSFGHFDLPPEEALVVTLSTGKASYWVLPACTLGMITHGPWANIVSFNNKQARPNKNGTYTFVISQRDPGVYNWVNTTSRTQGTLMGRWQGLPTEENEDNGIEVSSFVAPLASLKDTGVLPEETEWVDEKQREQQRLERVRGYERIHFA